MLTKLKLLIYKLRLKRNGINYKDFENFCKVHKFLEENERQPRSTFNLEIQKEFKQKEN